MTTENELIKTDITAYLEKYQNKELLRFVAVGSVDDGKSTLIGRLLHDTGMVYEDQIESVKKASAIEGEEIDFSLFTDGLKAEREQGITIDVAYRYFSTEKRKFIIADTPGHIQYTRNMVTGASTANVALILIDARLGVLQQSRRHAYIASLLGIPHLAVCVNKLDLKDYSQTVFEEIKKDFDQFASTLSFKDVTFFPISALKGDNIVEKSDQTDWYHGQSVLQYLETVPIAEDRNAENFRFPVQHVSRPNLDYRGFAGEVASGTIHVGDEITVLPSLKTSKVQSIDTFDGTIDEAFAPLAVTLRLEDEIDISRGDTLVKTGDLATMSQRFRTHLVWMSEETMDVQKPYFLKHTTQTTRANVEQVVSKKNMDTLEDNSADKFELNDIGQVIIQCHRPLFFDAYAQNRKTGAFILIDPLSNNTVAAGMMIDDASREADKIGQSQLRSQLSKEDREKRLGQKGSWIRFENFETANKLASSLEKKLFDANKLPVLLDERLYSKDELDNLAERMIHAGLIVISVSRTKGTQKTSSNSVWVLNAAEAENAEKVFDELKNAGRI